MCNAYEVERQMRIFLTKFRDDLLQFRAVILARIAYGKYLFNALVEQFRFFAQAVEIVDQDEALAVEMFTCRRKRKFSSVTVE